MPEQILVRPIEELAEIRECVELQRQIWSFNETDVVPEAMFVVAHETGGQVLGAFDRSRLIGFALSYAGWRAGVSYLHSHMAGVLSEYRDRGVGRLLKLSQREDALERGFSCIEWTFDPLQLKNAYFNLTRLGAVVHKYLPNLYGRTSSPLNGGLQTDRLLAEWWVRSTRVEGLLAGGKAEPGSHQEMISIPSSIRQICEQSPKEAESIQTQVREQFQHLIATGYAAVEFVFDQEKGSYLLEPYEN